MAVLYGILRLLPQKPDLVVSGINYGLNVGSGVTISGTVGAALEAAAAEIPAMAISLETEKKYHSSYSREIDFTTAGFFTRYFSNILITKKMPKDVHVLKVEVPAQASPETPWQTTQLSMMRFYEPISTGKKTDSGIEEISYDIASDWDKSPTGTDSHAVVNRGEISVTPLSLDLTSRTNIEDLEKLLRED
jgi:5'-nucleotidase